MVSQTQISSTPSVTYPDSDGQPMANNTEQFRWIVTIQQNLDWLFAENPNVFVAGDLFWYPVEGRNDIVVAPDVMVVLGRPKGKRGSYKQWEEDNIAPQVVFEILSPSNTQNEMDRKLLFFERYGVEEYYIYDPDQNQLRGFLRGGDGLEVIEPISTWESPRLKIQFALLPETLQLTHPDGKPFLSYLEIAEQAEAARQRAEAAEQRADAAEQRSTQLAERLRALGVDPEEI
ncbi:Uma2 family endonuclease [Egbenema bharatensis]|uniref:Uma2 family endonuclease n=1 Tax=Egbenema bharatensis TaxID=3463334 RepID=UPI003A872D8B